MVGFRLAWAVSGSGTTLQAVVKASKQHLLESRIVLALADRELPVQVFCQKEGMAFRSITPQANIPWSTLQDDFRQALLESNVDWLFLTFNRLIGASVIDSVAGRVVNLHTSLLPAFPGFGAIRKALAARIRTTGVTLHLVDGGIDTGPILAQASCPIFEGDTEVTLGRRQFEAGVPVILQLIRSIERDELKLDSFYRPVWRNGFDRDYRLTVDEDLIDFSREFCRTQPTPTRYSAGRINFPASDPVQKNTSSTDTDPSKSP